MKGFMKKVIIQKIISFIILLVLINSVFPINSYAYEFGDITSSLLKEVVDLIASVGDIAMGALNHMMLGTHQIFGSSMLEVPIEDPNITDPSYESYLCPDVKSQNGIVFEDTKKTINDKKFDGLFISKGALIPNFLYCPENIFSNRIAALDINFLNPHEFTQVEFGENGDESAKKAESSAKVIRNTIASWYMVFRRIAIVGLLSVLVYIGIRIMISSTAADKAKYKENLNDWLVALVLVVVIHYIMAGILMINDNITQLLAKSNKTIIVDVTNDDSIPPFRTNLIGYIRFNAQSKDFGDATAYTIIYLALVIYTCMFTITYLKRFLYMAFFTMLAPLVALTYPLDKLRDGKAQAFDMWFKEYTMNVVIQPVHLILYTVLISSAIDLAIENPIYACVAIAFLLPAEKFIKKMFGLDRAQTTSGLGEIAGGALAMQGIKMIGNAVKGKEKEKSKISGGMTNNNNVRQVGDRGATSGAKGGMAGFLNGSNSNKPSKEENKNINRRPEKKDESIEEQIARETSDMTPQDYRETGYTPEEKNGEKEQEIIDERDKKVDNTEVIKDDSKEPEEVEKSSQDDNDNGSQIEDTKKGQNQSLFKGTIQEGNQSQKKINTKAKVKRVGRALGTSLVYPTKRKIKNTFSKDGLKEGLKKGGKFVGRTAYKVATKGAGMAVGATALGTAAIAAGIATGDISKAASMAAGGIALGAGVGGSVSGRLGDKAKGKFDEKKQAFDAAYYDKAELKRKQQEKYDRNWKKDEDNYQYLYKQGLRDKEAKEFLESEQTQKYLNAGVTDIGTIYKTQKLMKEDSHKDKSEDYAISLAQLASKQNSEYVSNYNMQNSVMDNLERNGVNKKDTKNINKDLIKILE